MRIGICEDDRDLRHALRQMLMERAPSGVDQIKMYNSGDALWFDYQDYICPFDLLILDIEMPGKLNGLDVARKIRGMGDPVKILILTSHKEYALVGYGVRPFNFLVKPVCREELYENIRNVEEQLRVTWGDCLNLQMAGGLMRIPFDDILYLESKRHHVYIHMRTTGEPLKHYGKLADVLERCDERFLCPHKSYAVNADKIQKIGDRYKKIFIFGGREIPISQQRKKEFIRALTRYDLNYRTIRA